MSDTASDPVTSDPNWAAVTRFLEGRVTRGQRITAPAPFAPVLGPLAAPDASVPDWAVVHKGQMEDYPEPTLRRIAAMATPVFANDVFVVFARRPTFGLRNQRSSVHVTALLERLEPGEAAGPVPDDDPGNADLLPAAPASAPALPPEALALLSPAPPAPRPAGEAAPRPASGSLPASASPAAPARQDLAGGSLPRRIAVLVPEARTGRVAEIGMPGLAAALGMRAVEGGAAADVVLLRAGSSGDLAASLDPARRRLAPRGVLVLLADNAASLGRRLCEAAGRPAAGGLRLPDLLGALRATGFRPRHAEGFSLDPWRPAAEEAPPEQWPGTPGGDVLDEAGAEAGTAWAAYLLLVADPD